MNNSSNIQYIATNLGELLVGVHDLRALCLLNRHFFFRFRVSHVDFRLCELLDTEDSDEEALVSLDPRP